MKTKLIGIILCILTSAFFHLSIQAQTWSWGKNVASQSYSTTFAKLAKGIDGSYFIADTYVDTVILGSQTLKAVNQDFYITKHDSSGNLVWSISDKGLPTGSNPSSFQTALASINADKSGNVFALGNYGYTLSTLKNVFITKYNSSGVRQWQAWAESASLVASAGMCTDDSGNVYVTGHTSNTITFYNKDGTQRPNNVIVTSGTEFLAKYNSSGVFQWVKDYSANTWPTRAYSLTTTIDGILLCGYTDGNGTVTFGNSITVVVSTSKKAAFVVKYDFNGLAKWSLKAEGTDRPFIALAVDNNSNIIMCGKLNEGSIGSYATSSVVSMGFIAKANSSGAVQWAYFDENSSFKYSQRVGIATNNSNILVVGNWYNNGFIVVQRFDNSGNYQAVDSASNDVHSNIKANDFITTSTGSFILTGSYCSTLKKGSVNITTQCGIGKGNIFVAKILPVGGTTTSIKKIDKDFVKLIISPNPSDGKFEIQLQDLQNPAGHCSIEIYNILGEKLYQSYLEEKSTIDLTSQKDGIYFVHLKSGNESFIQKISIRH